MVTSSAFKQVAAARSWIVDLESTDVRIVRRNSKEPPLAGWLLRVSGVEFVRTGSIRQR